MSITIDLFNACQNVNSDVCLICHDNIDSEQNYTLECNHKYHVECIINWFRLGHQNCPYCNAQPINSNDNHIGYGGGFYSKKQLDINFRIIKNYAKKKDCPEKLKKKVNTVVKNQIELKELQTQKANLSKETGVYTELNKKFRSLNSKIWQKMSRVNMLKKSLVSMVNIVPITIFKTNTIKSNTDT